MKSAKPRLLVLLGTLDDDRYFAYPNSYVLKSHSSSSGSLITAGSFATARTAICRTSIGVASFTRTFADMC